jgi:hypothetical protein
MSPHENPHENPDENPDENKHKNALHWATGLLVMAG